MPCLKLEGLNRVKPFTFHSRLQTIFESLQNWNNKPAQHDPKQTAKLLNSVM